MKIGIIGKGTVGKAVYEGLNHLGHEMCFFDPAYEGSKLEDVLGADCVFISVPTNQAPNGDCDTSIVEKVIEELNLASYKGLIGIKSTIVPGTCERLSKHFPNLRICSVPEFLRAKTALADFMYNHDLLVIGSNRDEDFTLVKKIHGHLPKNVACVKPTEAEVIKYFNNVNHSVQIIFANIAYEVCKKLGVHYDAVYHAISQRECFNPAYLMCNENLRGFGGHCLPKDTSAWCNLVKDLGLPYEMIGAIIRDNEKINK
ncbi:MAG: UDP-glucose/GDP-mannose dehydrogenase family protein [Alphaproteobacteria bacterium]|nr:UDP-glucose/GDP-mannose dehydrogenase family protein [Alphaproteobacteria bacterium]